jgi:hypothetical protein
MKTELEEAAKGYSGRHQDVSENLGKYLVSAVFQDGANYQAERMYSRMYSDEEVLELLLSRPGPYLTDEEIKEWFEQFKKK